MPGGALAVTPFGFQQHGHVPQGGDPADSGNGQGDCQQKSIAANQRSPCQDRRDNEGASDGDILPSAEIRIADPARKDGQQKPEEKGGHHQEEHHRGMLKRTGNVTGSHADGPDINIEKRDRPPDHQQGKIQYAGQEQRTMRCGKDYCDTCQHQMSP